MNTFSTNLLKRVRPRDRFYVASLVAGEARFARFSVDLNRRDINIEHIETHSFKPDDTEGALNLLRRFLHQYPRRRKAPVLISLDPNIATTVQSAVMIEREKPDEAIDESDLDNRVAQGIWRLVNSERNRAAKKMGVHDLDVIMTEVGVKQARLDSHRVVNPLGFPARTIEMVFASTFSPRLFAEDLRELVPAPQTLFSGEHGVFEASLLSKSTGKDQFLLIQIFADRCHLFTVSGKNIGSIPSFSWGRKNLVRVLKTDFLVNESVAEKMLELYLLRQASPSMLRRIEKLLQAEFKNFQEILVDPIKKYSPRAVYLSSTFELPAFVFSPGFRGAFSERIRFLPVEKEMFFRDFGFSVHLPLGITPAAASQPLAAFLEFYFIPRSDKMNAIAKRHARWLLTD